MESDKYKKINEKKGLKKKVISTNEGKQKFINMFLIKWFFRSN